MSAAARFGIAVTAAPRQKKTLRDSIAQGSGGDPSGELSRVQQPHFDSFDSGWQLNDAGDTATAVLNRGESAFDVAVALQEAAWPLRLRFSLVSAPPAGAAGQDDAVREKALRALKKSDKRERFTFEISNRNEAELNLAGALAKLHFTLTAEWTAARSTAVRAYRRLGKQAEVAAELGVSQQAVSQMLLGARFRELQAAENSMREWLSGPQRTSLWPLRNIGTAPAGV